MVEQQIKQRGISDVHVIKAMLNIPRHEFVPAEYQPFAYADHPLPIGESQTISQPYIVALMTESLHLKGHERVLEIGTGSGYQAAVLSVLTDTVFTIEIIPALSEIAKSTLQRLNFSNICCRIGDGYHGWAEKAPFDAIVVTAAPSQIPQPLIDQLAPNGRMVIPVGDVFQELILIQKDKQGTIYRHSIVPVRFVPMTGKAQQHQD
ncbi:protein-L-isoaspartate(D-aspartate) O-methyltransferase [candidate division KSB1 bacterium]|nr:protein-L-isoaspartate(D-aspartate) O-methyltransferase [candidate division KSB1 bacterium]